MGSLSHLVEVWFEVLWWSHRIQNWMWYLTKYSVSRVITGLVCFSGWSTGEAPGLGFSKRAVQQSATMLILGNLHHFWKCGRERELLVSSFLLNEATVRKTWQLQSFHAITVSHVWWRLVWINYWRWYYSPLLQLTFPKKALFYKTKVSGASSPASLFLVKQTSVAFCLLWPEEQAGQVMASPHIQNSCLHSNSGINQTHLDKVGRGRLTWSLGHRNTGRNPRCWCRPGYSGSLTVPPHTHQHLDGIRIFFFVPIMQEDTLTWKVCLQQWL